MIYHCHSFTSFLVIHPFYSFFTIHPVDGKRGGGPGSSQGGQHQNPTGQYCISVLTLFWSKVFFFIETLGLCQNKGSLKQGYLCY